MNTPAMPSAPQATGGVEMTMTCDNVRFAHVATPTPGVTVCVLVTYPNDTAPPDGLVPIMLAAADRLAALFTEPEAGS